MKEDDSERLIIDANITVDQEGKIDYETFVWNLFS